MKSRLILEEQRFAAPSVKTTLRPGRATASGPLRDFNVE